MLLHIIMEKEKAVLKEGRAPRGVAGRLLSRALKDGQADSAMAD